MAGSNVICSSIRLVTQQDVGGVETSAYTSGMEHKQRIHSQDLEYTDDYSLLNVAENVVLSEGCP